MVICIIIEDLINTMFLSDFINSVSKQNISISKIISLLFL